jgi:hypothetical protein
MFHHAAFHELINMRCGSIADFPHLAPVVRERGLSGSYSLSLDHHAISSDSKGSLHWLAGSLGRINRVFPTLLPKIKLYYQVSYYL